MRPRLALIAQNPAIRYVYEAAAAEDVDVVHVHLPQVGAPPDLPAVVDRVALDIFGARDEAMEELRRADEQRPFAGALTLYEAAVPFTAQLAARLHLPGLPVPVARRCRDKLAQRQAFHRRGLACPGFARARTPAHAARLAARLRLPVVVKPTNGLSSQGVVRADTPLEVEVAARLVDAINTETLRRYTDESTGEQPGILVEEFIDGPEFCVEAFTHDGVTAILAIADKGYPTGPTFEEGTYITPPDLPSDVIDTVCATVVAAHKALGITTGASHTELRLLDGATPVLLEVGARMGGSGVVHLPVAKSTGVDFARLVVRAALGREPNPMPTLRPRPYATSANWIVPLAGHGEYGGLRGLDEVLRHPDTVEVLQLLASGAQVPAWPRFTGYPGFVLSRHATYAQCRDYQAWLGDTLTSTWLSTAEPARHRQSDTRTDA